MKSRRDPKKPYVDDGPTIRQLHPDFADQFDDKTEPQAGPPPDDVLTEDDIDDQAPTVERRLPKGALSPGLPRFEMTGTITLPRSQNDDEPVVRTETEVEPVRTETEVEPVRTETEVEPVTLRQKRPVAPAPAKLAPLARPLPPPKPLRPPQPLPSPRPAPAAFSLREPPLPSDFAPTPIRKIPSSPPPPARRIPSVSPPPPARRPTSVPPPAPARRPTSVAPPAPERRPTSVAPPAPERRHTSVAPPARAAYVAPRPAAGRAPSERPPPTEVRVRPRPPEYDAPRADATRPFPLQEPERRGAGETPSHTPPPLTASTPPPAAVSSRPPARPTAPVFSSFPPPPPIPRLRSSTRVSLEAHRNRRNLVAAGVGIASALAISAVIGVMVAITVRTDDGPTSAPTLPARRVTPARAPEGVIAPSLPVTVATATATPPATATAPAPTPAGTAIGGCRLERRAQRLAGPAMPTVLPMVATAPGTARVAVGYASGRNHADGIVVHLDDFTVEPRYSEELARPVLRVTPLTDRAPVAFAVDHDESGVQAVRTIPAHPPFRVGVSFFGFVRVNESMSPSVVWPGGRYEALSEPAFATTDRDGYGVAFRSGRGSGDVFTGWLTPSGTADGDLVRVDAGAREVGAPAIAASDRGVAVVFAARASGEVWRLRGATAPRGRAPQSSRELDVALPGAGDTISPSLVALPSGGWVVQWLEGAQNARRVLARTLNDKLEPEGLPVELGSQPGIQDTPGALVVRDGRVLAVQLVAVDRAVELWGAVLACGAP